MNITKQKRVNVKKNEIITMSMGGDLKADNSLISTTIRKTHIGINKGIPIISNSSPRVLSHKILIFLFRIADHLNFPKTEQKPFLIHYSLFSIHLKCQYYTSIIQWFLKYCGNSDTFVQFSCTIISETFSLSYTFSAHSPSCITVFKKMLESSR